MKTKLEQLYENENINYIYNNCKWTNTLQHWKDIKEESIRKYGLNTVIFYQVGSFFESYFYDAYLTSELVGQSLTSKDKSNPLAAPMSWSPLASWLERAKRLLKAWYNVVLVEEVGLVGSPDFKREVTQVLTPWTNFEEVWSKINSYLYSFYFDYNTLWVSIIDVSSNQLYITQEIFQNNIWLSEYIEKLFSIYPPKEIIWNVHSTEVIDRTILVYQTTSELVSLHFPNSINYFQENKLNVVKESVNLLLNYIRDVHLTDLTYIDSFELISTSDSFHLDSMTIKNLEIFKNSDWSKEYSLCNILDSTSTSFWSRHFKLDLVTPLKDKSLIEEKLNGISTLLENQDKLLLLEQLLIQLPDIERLATRLSTLQCTPNDILQLTKWLELLKNIKWYTEELSKNSVYLSKLTKEIQLFETFIQGVKKVLRETGGNSSKEWTIINRGINKELDTYFDLTSDKWNWYDTYQEKLIKETEIKNLRVSENNLWAYIEVKAWTENIPVDWKRIKMLKDYDRYETKELVEFFRWTFDATVKRNQLEYTIFQQLRLQLSTFISAIHKTAKIIAKIDILCSHSRLAIKYKYCKPEIVETKEIYIKEWRHSVVEQITDFVNNDTHFDYDNTLHIITGPNMWGKSTYIRQIAIIVLLSQIGSYVPATEAKIWLVDWIFTRVWANDNLSQGQSTFYLEMKEVSDILNSCTSNSLLILDEVWRGTSTDDWFALAQSLCEYLLEKKIRTVFATHYHQLNTLETLYSWILTFSVDAEIEDGKILKFNHKIKVWWATNSYGIEIWDLAWLPKSIIIRARQLKKITRK